MSMVVEMRECRTCGTHLHDHGVELLAISRLLGHSRLATTQVYTRVSTGRMLDVYRKAHPHARLYK